MDELPQLRVVSRPIDSAAELLQFADAQHPLVMVRRGEGVVGRGVAVRAEFSSTGQIAQARQWFAKLTAAASVDDAVQLPGSGLVAFGSFNFDDRDAAPSVVVVPEIIVGRRDGRTFITQISAAAAPIAAKLPLAQPLGPDASCELVAPTGERERHRSAVEQAITRIRRGQLQKVVVARQAVGRIRADADLRHPLYRFEESYNDTWIYAVAGMLGASPEMLVRVLDGEVAARVLAGTAPRGTDAGSDAAASEALRVSAKNRAEHRFAVESALASLDRLDSHDDPAGGLTASPEPFLLQLPNVWHLASDLRGRMPAGASPLDLVEALHPTAAVGGTPTAEAMNTIRKLEGCDRGRYAGPTGWVSAAGDGEWVVALRGAQFATGGEVVAFSGGGIMAASQPDDEWLETEVKLAPIRAALGG
ncbi:chorismate-binding protein [uncultured Gulosibacter sp.]|uniref:isochorismate synthase n=1 Tax=uncultured Gulosibacter sp. TaxID=1339167 RepID=UPI00288A5967|nr:chorismate-binding protein [uncultured Gulosibacter sp.]